MDMRVASGMARYGSAGVVLGVALCWGAGMRGPLAAAQTDRGGGSAAQTNPARSPESARAQPARQSTMGESNGTLAMITGASGGQGQTQWLYLIDTKSRSFALYRIDPMNSKGIVKLEASRQYEWDLKLEHYNNQPPEPDAIKATVQTLSRSPQ
jgi:hypothetical protein